MTALELAAEDLARLCRQVPGGDLITLSHWRKAVQVAGYISKANDLYSYLLPFLSPVGGLARWGSREWIVKPAWKSMQQNMLRWFYQAYVNRLGAHLIELLSGRLAIGADQYRRLTRKSHAAAQAGARRDAAADDLSWPARARSGKSRLIARLREACSGDLTLLKARLSNLAIEPDLIDRLRDAHWVEAPDYTTWTDSESRRDRARRQAAVEAAVQADMLILVINGRQPSDQADVAFAQAWDRWFIEHPRSEVPPALVVLTGVEGPEFGNGWQPPYDWSAGHGASRDGRPRPDRRPASDPPPVIQRLRRGRADRPDSLRGRRAPPARDRDALASAERTALIRRLHEMGGRSKVGRLVRQLGVQGRSLLGNLRSRKKAGSES